MPEFFHHYMNLIKVPSLTLRGRGCVFRAFVVGAITFGGSQLLADTPSITSTPFYSDLIPPHQLELYEKDPSTLNVREQWRIRMHGLRFAILHPLVWGTRKAERTENRQIIPLKLFVLRSSEHSDYLLSHFKMSFRYRRIPLGRIENNPRDYDPLFEIGLGGEYQRGKPAGLPLIDRSYVLRISGIPGLDTGLYYRSLATYHLVQKAKIPKIESGKRYDLELKVGAHNCLILLNGEEILDFKNKFLQRGLVTIRSSWYPMNVPSLEISGTRGYGKDIQVISESGLVPALPEGVSRVEPALKDIPNL